MSECLVRNIDGKVDFCVAVVVPDRIFDASTFSAGFVQD